jgi:predicted esterase
MPRDPHKDQPILQAGAPLAEATGALILLHGRAGSAQDMLTLARDLDMGQGVRRAWFVPEAAGRQWYPYSLLEKVEKNQGALNSALGLVKRILEKAAAANIPPERTVLLGFSQGATVALEFAARNARRYGGVIALSGALLGPEGTPREYAGSLAQTPVFLGSGDRDPHIPKRRVDETALVFERLGATVTKRIYEGLAHAIDPDEIERARAMLEGIAR